MIAPTGGRGRAVGWLPAVMVVALLAACTSSGGTTKNAGATVDLSSTPRTEAPTTEAAGNGGGKPSLSVPSLPIGGNVDVDGAQQCAHVNWLGPKPIPHDVVIKLSGFSLDPTDIFRFGGDLCGTSEPTCTTSWQWRWDSANLECLVPVVQEAEADADQTVSLVLSGTVFCSQAASCTAFRNAGESQIVFTPVPGAVSGSTAPPTG